MEERGGGSDAVTLAVGSGTGTTNILFEKQVLLQPLYGITSHTDRANATMSSAFRNSSLS
jgi:hypothetical protein